MDFGVRYFQTNRLSMLQNSRVAYPLRATNMLRKKVRSYRISDAQLMGDPQIPQSRSDWDVINGSLKKLSGHDATC